jgi:hypothetical protein
MNVYTEKNCNHCLIRNENRSKKILILDLSPKYFQPCVSSPSILVTDNGNDKFDFSARSSTNITNIDYSVRFDRQKKHIEYDNEILNQHNLSLILENNKLKDTIKWEQMNRLSITNLFEATARELVIIKEDYLNMKIQNTELQKSIVSIHERLTATDVQHDDLTKSVIYETLQAALGSENHGGHFLNRLKSSFKIKK